LIKVLAEKKGTETFIRAAHILLTVPPGHDAEVMKQAKELIARARKGENFGELARMYSQEPGAAQSGGELGWFGKGKMVKPFEDAAMKGKPGEIIGPVKTQFGIHIIKIEGRDDREVKLADIHLAVKAGSETKDQAYQNAQDFAYVSKHGDFEKEAHGLKLQIRETPSFMKSQFIPGIGYNPYLSRFAFSGDKGDVSDAIQVSDGYAVCQISDIKKEGVRPFDDVKASLTSRVMREKKMAILKEIVSKDRSTLQDTANLSQLASLHPNVIVQTTGQFGPEGGIPTVGNEEAFVGTALVMPLGRISDPVAGTRGYYLIKVLSRTPFDSAAFDAQKTVLAAQLLQEKKQLFLSSWFQNLKDKADIDDERDLFYR
jgi:peptidyl-prolyl cis-trans isomerase D